ncbi:ester cyclase [Paraburkholderia bengalensis]|uniref:Ester cyclase n=1 Tax=Paraburkholderia bengalensis TaxID=2747562 RepID=A0ABU8IQZ3_9BURK
MTTNTISRLTNAEVLDLLAKAKNKQDVDEALTVAHEDVVIEIPSYDASGRGKEEVGALWRHFFVLFPDYAVSLDSVWDAPDGGIAVQGKISVTLTGEFEGHAPNGKRVTVPAFMLFGFRDEKISYELFHIDFGTICRASGVPLESAVAAIKKEARWSEYKHA